MQQSSFKTTHTSKSVAASNKAPATFKYVLKPHIDTN